MTKWQEERFAWAKAQAIYDWKDYWKIAPLLDAQGIHVKPEMFGCMDWEHDGDGHLRTDWACYGASFREVYPDFESAPEVLARLCGMRERQRYNEPIINEEDTRWDNEQVGWSRMVDKGIMNDYWRMRGLYYDWGPMGAI